MVALNKYKKFNKYLFRFGVFSLMVSGGLLLGTMKVEAAGYIPYGGELSIDQDFSIAVSSSIKMTCDSGKAPVNGYMGQNTKCTATIKMDPNNVMKFYGWGNGSPMSTTGSVTGNYPSISLTTRWKKTTTPGFSTSRTVTHTYSWDVDSGPPVLKVENAKYSNQRTDEAGGYSKWKVTTYNYKDGPACSNKSYKVKCSDSLTGCKSSSGTLYTSSSNSSLNMYDKVNNKGVAHVALTIDKSAPSSCSGYAGNANTWSKEKTIYGECTRDNLACGKTGSKKVTSNGTHYVSCYDSCGNSRTVGVNVNRIDRTAPSCGTVKTPSGSYYYKTSFKVSAGCKDSQSGCTKGTYTETKTTSSGSITIKDKVGWTKTCNYSGVKLDKTKPSTTISYGSGYGSLDEKYQSSDGQVPVVISAKDNAAGIDRVCYRMSGAQSQGDTCVKGSSTTVYVKNAGTTTITAWSYDKARDYPEPGGSGSYNSSTGGNKSDSVSKKVWIDRTAPTISFSSNNDGYTWKNTATPVSVTIKDSGSGVGGYRYYWSTSSSDAYDEGTALYRGSSGNIVAADTSGSWINNKVFTETHPTNSAHNDVIYLHVKACDRSFNNNNCSTATYKVGIHFDNMKPNKPAVDKSSQEWVNKFQLTIRTNENVQSGKKNSGLNTIYTYWDVNPNHKEDGYSTGNSSFGGTASLTNAHPGNSYVASYNWTLDFANLKNKLRNGGESSVGAAAEGSRFIKIQVSDIAGNYSDYLVTGPYKWDTSKPNTKIDDIFGDERTFLPAEKQ